MFNYTMLMTFLAAALGVGSEEHPVLADRLRKELASCAKGADGAIPALVLLAVRWVLLRNNWCQAVLHATAVTLRPSLGSADSASFTTTRPLEDEASRVNGDGTSEVVVTVTIASNLMPAWNESMIEIGEILEVQQTA